MKLVIQIFCLFMLSLTQAGMAADVEVKERPFKVIFFPVLHHLRTGDCEASAQSQFQLYLALKKLLKAESEIKIVSESLFYNVDNQSEFWFKNKYKFSDLPGRRNVWKYLRKHDALELLYGKKILGPANLVKSTNTDLGSPYSCALHAFAQYVASPRDLKSLRQVMHFDRELEWMENLARSLKENPRTTHVLIAGQTHELSRFFANADQIDFSIAAGFSERPADDDMQPTSACYEAFFNEQLNPLVEFVQ